MSARTDFGWANTRVENRNLVFLGDRLSRPPRIRERPDAWVCMQRLRPVVQVFEARLEAVVAFLSEQGVEE